MEVLCPYYWVKGFEDKKVKPLDTELLTNQMRTATSSLHDKSDRLVNAKMLFAWTDPVLYGEVYANYLFQVFTLFSTFRHLDYST